MIKPGRYGGSRWSGLLGGPQAQMGAAPGANNAGWAKLASALLKNGTPQVARKQYIGNQNPAMSPGALFRMRMGGGK